MAQLPFKINIETENGTQISYASGGFATTEESGISGSNILSRIDSLPSTSYSSDTLIGDTEGTTFASARNLWISASYIGGSSTENTDTGSITFHHTDTLDSNDRLKRYRFFGTKVCNVLGLPAEHWIHPENFSLDDTGTGTNYFSGNINATNLSVAKDISFSPISSVTTNVRFNVGDENRPSTDLFVQFTTGSGLTQRNQLLMGYDTSDDKYKLHSPNDADGVLHFRSASFAKAYVGDGSSWDTSRAAFDRNDLAYETVCLHGGFNYGVAAETEVFLPINGTLTETVSNTFGEGNRFVAPYDGYLAKIMVAGDFPSSPSGFSHAHFYKSIDASGTMPALGSPTFEYTVNNVMLLEDYTGTFVYNTGVHAQPTDTTGFGAGDILYFSLDPKDDIDDTYFTVVLKMKTRF